MPVVVPELESIVQLQMIIFPVQVVANKYFLSRLDADDSTVVPESLMTSMYRTTPNSPQFSVPVHFPSNFLQFVDWSIFGVSCPFGFFEAPEFFPTSLCFGLADCSAF